MYIDPSKVPGTPVGDDISPEHNPAPGKVFLLWSSFGVDGAFTSGVALAQRIKELRPLASYRTVQFRIDETDLV